MKGEEEGSSVIPEYDTRHSQAVSGPRQPTVSIHLSIETDANYYNGFCVGLFPFFLGKKEQR